MRSRELVARSAEYTAVRRAVEDGTNVLLVGDAGVGKSHLARAVASSLEHDGWHLAVVGGSPALQGIHLGAAQSLITPSAARSPLELFANVETDLRREANRKPVCLLVDDIDLVDPASAALLQQLTAKGMLAIATVRSDAVSDALVVPLWKDDLFQRFDLGAFNKVASATFVDTVLGGPSDSNLHHAIFELAAGNALFTRELIADARQSGSIASTESGWQLVSELRSARRVSDLFAARLGSFDPVLRTSLESIALAEVLPLAIAQELIGHSQLEELESLDMVMVAAGVVRPAHPLLGKVVQNEVPSLRRERLIGELIDTIINSQSTTRADVLRAVRWQLERGEAVRPDLAAGAAEAALALFDGETAVVCAEAAFDDSSHAGVILGRALLTAQRIPEALDSLRSAHANAITETERSVAAVALSDTLIFAAGDFDGASSLLEEELDSLTQAPARAIVAGNLALARSLLGNFQPALRYGDELIDSSEIDDGARLHLLVMWTIAAALSGRRHQTEERIGQAIKLAEQYRAILPAALDQLLVTQFSWDLSDGRMATAIRMCRLQQTHAKEEGRLTALWDLCLSQAASMVGNGRIACESGDASTQSHELNDPLGTMALSLAAHSQALALTGDLDRARTVHAQAKADPRCGPRESAYLGRSLANISALEGRIDDAIDAIFEGVAGAGDSLVWSGWLLYDAVRFGHADRVSEQLRSVADQAPVESVLAMTDHCDALLARDPVRLTKAADRFADAGFVLFASEATAHAAVELARLGDTTGASCAALRACLLFDQCDSARSLAIEGVTNPLSSREVDIARSASAGTPSQTIAEEAFVSRRTVDNHLQNIYRKLGINQRSELAPIFALPTDHFTADTT